MQTQISIGARLRALRDERGLSQRELAQRANVSANAISLIERDENSPSVATLQSLAAALNVKVSFFFDEQDNRRVLLARAGARPALESRGVSVEALGGELRRQEIEPFIIRLAPHAESGERQVVHTGHELVYCLNGQVEYLIDGQVYTLQPGDFLLFEAHLPHIWRNVTEQPAEFILVLQSPGQSDEPVERHFSDYPSLTHLK